MCEFAKLICFSEVVFHMTKQPDVGLTKYPTLSLFLFLGIINTSFPLSDQPMLGEWSVYAEVQGHTYNKTFEVQKYGK